MAGIYWLASYPKSGNTWLRTLLTNYWRNDNKPININQLGGRPITSSRSAFDSLMGIDSADMTPEEVDAHKPLLCQHLVSQAEADLFIKVHDAYAHTIYDQPMFPPEVTAGVIYLIRNPLDVTVSFAHHQNMTVEKVVDQMGSHDTCLEGSKRRLLTMLKQDLFSWSEHVLSWVDAKNQRVQVIRYEDMVMDPVGTFSQVIRFCGLEEDAERIHKAVTFSRFETLQAQESDHGFGEKMPLAQSFFRKGKIGGWREQLSEKQVQQLIDDHREVMQRFNYPTAAGELVF